MVMLSTSRSILVAFVLLAVAALVFAVWPLVHREPISQPLSLPIQSGSIQSGPSQSGSSTFGGQIAAPRPDFRSPAPVSGQEKQAWPAFAPRSGGLYTAPAGGN
ncbi:hypothetical protein H4S14_001296 [Agrobacterium vitis]|nr:hypothetical protein [Agrobacterium vitis]MBE1437558.1 hypothetical protein [Agrobacterium vitis]